MRSLLIGLAIAAITLTASQAYAGNTACAKNKVWKGGRYTCDVVEQNW
jgi:hypothetical protein